MRTQHADVHLPSQASVQGPEGAEPLHKDAKQMQRPLSVATPSRRKQRVREGAQPLQSGARQEGAAGQAALPKSKRNRGHRTPQVDATRKEKGAARPRQQPPAHTQAALVQAVPVRAKGPASEQPPRKLKKADDRPAQGVAKMAVQTASGTVETAGETTASVYEDFYRTLGYRFSDEALLQLALTHCSFCGTAGQNNQRLEYLGDAVLEFVISEGVYNRSEVDEGHLTRMRANVVCEASLAQAAQQLCLGELLQLGKGEESTGGREKASILADAMEAVIGAVYLDGGIRGARKCIRRALGKKLDEAVSEGGGQDYKTQLQHLCNVKKLQAPYYALRETLGPAHDRTFTIAVMVGEQEISRAAGRSKKEAEQQAARMAVTQLKKKKKR